MGCIKIRQNLQAWIPQFSSADFSNLEDTSQPHLRTWSLLQSELPLLVLLVKLVLSSATSLLRDACLDHTKESFYSFWSSHKLRRSSRDLSWNLRMEPMIVLLTSSQPQIHLLLSKMLM